MKHKNEEMNVKRRKAWFDSPPLICEDRKWPLKCIKLPFVCQLLVL